MSPWGRFPYRSVLAKNMTFDWYQPDNKYFQQSQQIGYIALPSWRCSAHPIGLELKIIASGWGTALTGCSDDRWINKTMNYSWRTFSQPTHSTIVADQYLSNCRSNLFVVVVTSGWVAFLSVSFWDPHVEPYHRYHFNEWQKCCYDRFI